MDPLDASGIRREPGAAAATETAPPLAPAFPHRPTWAEWLDWQAEHTVGAQHRLSSQQVIPFTGRELARLQFLRWLYATGQIAA